MNTPYRYSTVTGWLRIEELWPEEEAAAAVTAEERALAARYSAPQRRREFLSWRALLRRELGPVPVDYTSAGAPYLLEEGGWIGVSHSRRYVALAYSSQSPCAVDVESADRNFSAIRSRYLTLEEEALSPHPAWCCIAWCAKECLYKLGGRREIDLLRDIRLQSGAPAAADEGEIRGEVLGRSHRLHFARIGTDWALWCLE